MYIYRVVERFQNLFLWTKNWFYSKSHSHDRSLRCLNRVKKSPASNIKKCCESSLFSSNIKFRGKKIKYHEETLHIYINVCMRREKHVEDLYSLGRVCTDSRLDIIDFRFIRYTHSPKLFNVRRSIIVIHMVLIL